MTEVELKDALWQAVRAAAAIVVLLFVATPALAQDYTVGAEGRWWGVTVNWTAPAGHLPVSASVVNDTGQVLETHPLPGETSGVEAFAAVPAGAYLARITAGDVILAEGGFVVQLPAAKLSVEAGASWAWVTWTTNELDNRLRLDVIGGGQTVSYGLPNELTGVVDFPASGSYEAQIWAGDTLLDSVSFTIPDTWAVLEVTVNNNRAWGLWTASPGHERLILRLWYGSVVKDERVLSSDISGSEFFSGLKNGTYRAQILTLEGVILAQADFTIKKKGR